MNNDQMNMETIGTAFVVLFAIFLFGVGAMIAFN